MNRWKVITGILLILAVGAFSGALGTGIYTKNRIKRFMDPMGPPPPIRILGRQLDELDLSTAQQQKTGALLEAMHLEFLEIFQKTQPELQLIFNHHVNQLRAELTPGQQQLFDNTIQRIEERMQQMLARPFNRQGSPTALAQLQTELGLTPAQTERSERVIVSMENQKKALIARWTSARAKQIEMLTADLAALLDETEGELATFLTDDQAKRLREAYVLKTYQPYQRAMP
ncbi:MAG: hypothetical protein QNJ22_23255 [Desulfosarcinaceae bacterium]|nr:hypothetical protein [Desulfosarcinaceae bacterium]